MKSCTIVIVQEGKYFVAKNIDLGVVSQGENINEALENIKEASELFLEDNHSHLNRYNSQSFLTTISI